MASRQRPLSPFLHYRWQYTNTLSILHRLTGLLMSVGLGLFVYWLWAAAKGDAAYEDAAGVLSHPLARVALVGLSFAFFYHLLNGLRHLAWDAGYGFELGVARATGWAVFVAAVLLTALYWAMLLAGRAGGVT